MNNYELLGKPTGESISSNLQFMETRTLPEAIDDLKENPWEWTYRMAVDTMYCCMAHCHLGARSSKPIRETVSTAARLVHEYFATDWSNGDSEEAVVMRKERDNEDLAWFRLFTLGMLVAAFADDQKTMEVLANWAEPWLMPEFTDPPTDPLLAKTFISIIAAFRVTPLEGLNEIEAAVRKSRKKQPKLLFQAWEAARDHDQPSFEDALLQSVLQFEKTMREPMNPEDAIAFHQSVVLAVSRHYGMRLPDYEPKILARLISHESLGIPLPKKMR